MSISRTGTSQKATWPASRISLLNICIHQSNRHPHVLERVQEELIGLISVSITPPHPHRGIVQKGLTFGHPPDGAYFDQPSNSSPRCTPLSHCGTPGRLRALLHVLGGEIPMPTIDTIKNGGQALHLCRSCPNYCGQSSGPSGNLLPMGIAICVTLLSEIHFPNSSEESKPGSGWHTGHHRSSITDLRSLPDVYYNSATKNIAMDRDPRSRTWIQFTLSGEGILAPYSTSTASETFPSSRLCSTDGRCDTAPPGYRMEGTQALLRPSEREPPKGDSERPIHSSV